MVLNRFATTPSKGGQQYSFPILSPEEIIQCLSELQIPFSEEQLRKPTGDGVRSVFEQFLELVVGSSREELNQPVFGAADVLSYPELHEESISVLSFHRGMHKLLTASGVPDLCISDYAKPEYHRLRRLLSAVINLAKFREERLVHFQQLSSNSEGLAEKKQALEQTNAALRAQVREHEERVATEEPKVVALEESNALLGDELQTLHTYQNTLQEQVRNLKTKANDLGEKSAALKVKVLNEEQEVDRMRGLVVSSPDRVRRELDEQQEHLEYEREQVASMERRTHELQNRVGGLEASEREVMKVVAIMEECKNEMEHSQEQLQIVRDRKQAISVTESELRRQENQETYLRRQVQSAEERVSRIQRQIQERSAEVASTHERLEADQAAAERERTAVETRVAQNEAIVAQSNMKKAAVVKDFEDEIEQATGAYRSLEEEVVSYHRRLFGSMQLMNSS
mmetsp:Transcript_12155/g.37045  ORF Transcript_12155/g.37045 Transcript_12155/m.37045 type:complete len:455 (-) Transcript_12155:122-1486(-)|eukprot:CAMPEP_0198735028 /NCGR_PEP_ID=MMETSP1475-20131203/56810_1 /TAXON_ID= ORGANISM="Unidentified sp., Strain CCMP1999" /NCGR_SAMPLE_ID=MMETSP1475 /ASSEMBLY_ACC=CAM_ASM_001111 /LENGTH=454 /DNA_ID=CAMNT_0044498619 /DNA_START=99 /DNA_END=1463 /DNA_ORIENTATION=+